MARKKQKTEGQPEQISNVKDVTENTLEAENDVFADIMNVLLFGGRQEVTENELEHVQEVFQLMSALTGDRRFEETYQQTQEKGAKVGNMCEVLDRVENRGIAKGIQQGMQQGMQQGIQKGEQRGRVLEYIDIRREEKYTEEDIIQGIMQKFGLTAEQAESYMRGIAVDVVS